MTVTEITRLYEGGENFRIVDADRVGSRVNPHVLGEGDKNYVRVYFGKRVVAAIENASKKTVILYTKEQ